MIIVECARKAPCLQNRRNIKFLPRKQPSAGPSCPHTWQQPGEARGRAGLGSTLFQTTFHCQPASGVGPVMLTHTQQPPTLQLEHPLPLPPSQIIYKNTLLLATPCLKLGLASPTPSSYPCLSTIQIMEQTAVCFT